MTHRSYEPDADRHLDEGSEPPTEERTDAPGPDWEGAVRKYHHWLQAEKIRSRALTTTEQHIFEDAKGLIQ
jgi:hypothetical protein